MNLYRPSLEFTQFTTDYEFQEYIKIASEDYRAGTLRKEDPFQFFRGQQHSSN
jgi:hypothetical protein